MKIEYRRPYCDDFLSEYYRIHDLKNIEMLLSYVKLKERQNPASKFMMTLDDFGQASYTSMHTKMSNDLDDGEWLSAEDIDQSWFEDGFLKEELSFEQKFKIRRLGFKHGLEKSRYEDVFNKLLYLDEESRQELIDANQNILSLIDKESYLLKVPVKHCYEVIYAFPNGYFSCDLSPFENYYLAKHLEENFGLYLFGIGASYLAFRKGQGFYRENVNDLLDLLSRIYIKEKDNLLLEFFSKHVLENEIIILRYSE